MLSKLGIQLKKSVVAQVDFLKLCTETIRDVEDIADRGNLLNPRQCEDLSSKLLKTIQNIRRLVSRCGASRVVFPFALENLYRHAEKAKALVSNCGEEDWPTAAVFQIQNENAFRQILLDIGLCYNAIYEQAKCSSGGSNDFPEDLRLSSLFSPATEIDIQQDQQDLERRLEDFANEPSGSDVPAKRALKQCLARYLLVKLKHVVGRSEAAALETGSAILWTKEREPSGTWGMKSRFLGAGSGASGVNKTKWMGIRCAKKVFHASQCEAIFLKESGILAHLNHPCVVKFFCCGNEKMGKRFIAMELMEKSLLRLIEDQKNVCFPLPIAVDLMVQMARGMRYLHDQGIAHRDLKPLNVVVNTLTSRDVGDEFCVKLVDFGMSKTKVEASKLKTMSGFGIGTTQYKAPEVYRKAHRNGEGKTTWFKADVFSFAMTCAHVLSLKTPFGDIGVGSLYHELKNGTRPELPTHCPEELVGLLEACWDTDPTSRPHFMEICIRLESLHHKLLRGFASHGDEAQVMDFDGGLFFIKEMVKEQSFSQRLFGDGNGEEVDEIELTVVDEVEEELLDIEESDNKTVASVFLCPCGESLEFLPQAPYGSECFECNMCRIDSFGEVYHCANCEFDAHKDCAEIKNEVKVFFHGHPLHLLVEYYYDNNPDTVCDFCDESLHGSKWVYNCKECNFNVHALCTKHVQRVSFGHSHPLSLVQSRPRKHASCKSCNGGFQGYRYTCTRKGCSFDLHASCMILPRGPLCIFGSSHHLRMSMKEKGFYCGKCGGVGLSWRYECEDCFVDIHVDCVFGIEAEEVDDWTEAYEQLMLECENMANRVKMASTIVEFVDMLIMSTGLEMSSSSLARLQPVVMRVQPLFSSSAPSEASSSNAFDDVHLERKILVDLEDRKAKRMAVLETKLKARVQLARGHAEKLEKLGRLFQELMQISELDARVLNGAHEKLMKLQGFVDRVLTSSVCQVPRIVLRSDWSEGNELLSPLDYRTSSLLYLLCEEPGHEHIVALEDETYFCLDEEDLEKVKPLLEAGLLVVQKALNKAIDITDFKSVNLPILGERPWDLEAISLEKPDIQSNLANEDMEDVELQSRTKDIAAQWLCNYFENDDINIFKKFGLLRVCYTTTKQGDSPKYRQGPVAWLCTEHVNQGIGAGVLEPCPFRIYHNREYDLQRGFL